MSNQDRKPTEDLKEGLGLLFRGLTRTAERVARQVDVPKVAKETERVFESVGTEVVRAVARLVDTIKPVEPPARPAASAEPSARPAASADPPAAEKVRVATGEAPKPEAAREASAAAKEGDAPKAGDGKPAEPPRN